MIKFKIGQRWFFWLFSLAVLPFAVIWLVGWLLIHPAMRAVGAPPSDLPVERVVISDGTGVPIYGWFVAGIEKQGAVLLLHGVRADRSSMVERARFLHAAGYAVLLIDFQASGESPGKAITFGYREAGDVKAALRYLHHRLPGERIGIIGTSMGGAATILAEPALDADAVVLEQVYPTIQQALEDRLMIYLGPMGRWLAPFMLATLHSHLGIYPAQLRPVDHMAYLAMPKLLIAGDSDRHTTINESYAMFRAAAAPKELWVIHGAGHVDLCRYARNAYKVRVLRFFGVYLRGGA
jgi:uncharacterized protein